jgi:hypothetical protein
MNEEDEARLVQDIKYLEKVFKKWTPHMLSAPYIPTPSILIKDKLVKGQPNGKTLKTKTTSTTKPRSFKSRERFADIIDCLHKGAMAYSVGDYGTAINYFKRLLDQEWLKNATYFYLIKTLIKLDIEKELLSLRSKVNPNNIRMTK